MRNYSKIIANFRRKKILVIGDILLDQYIFGSVSRISPEAPVPIILQEGKSTYTPGGSANVANNLKALGADVSLVGKVGADAEGKILLKRLKEWKIDTEGVWGDRHFPTPIKTRIVAQNQQIVRLDREIIWDSSDRQKNRAIYDFIEKQLKRFDAIIISDYGKGMISPRLISEACSQAIAAGKIITVDPKVEHFGYYQGVTAITPNRKEAENAIRNIKISHPNGKDLAVDRDQLSDRNIERAGQELLKFLRLESLLITLGEHGMCLFERDKKPHHIPTRAREVYDVTGAGDTVIAVFTLALTAGATKLAAAELANFAAGVVVGHRGAVAITPKELCSAVVRYG